MRISVILPIILSGKNMIVLLLRFTFPNWQDSQRQIQKENEGQKEIQKT